jgi:hypothetical protein
MKWLDNVPLWVLVAGTAFLGMAPFVPGPHLWEKLMMLASGTLSRPIDIFDLLLHGAFPALLVFRLVRVSRSARQ